MRKFTLLLISLFFTLNMLGQAGKTHYVTTSTLNLRSAPSTDAEITLKLNQYDNLIILEDSIQNNWVKVQIGDNKGYVYKQFIKKGKAVVSTYSYRVGAVCKDGTRSSATGRGACSHHGGVSYWLTDTKKSVRIDED